MMKVRSTHRKTAKVVCSIGLAFAGLLAVILAARECKEMSARRAEGGCESSIFRLVWDWSRPDGQLPVAGFETGFDLEASDSDGFDSSQSSAEDIDLAASATLESVGSASSSGPERYTALGQIDGLGRGMGQQGGADQFGAGNRGNGSGQFPGMGSMGGGQGGVCMAPEIRFEDKASAELADRRGEAVSQKPRKGTFYSE